MNPNELKVGDRVRWFPGNTHEPTLDGTVESLTEPGLGCLRVDPTWGRGLPWYGFDTNMPDAKVRWDDGICNTVYEQFYSEDYRGRLEKLTVLDQIVEALDES